VAAAGRDRTLKRLRLIRVREVMGPVHGEQKSGPWVTADDDLRRVATLFLEHDVEIDPPSMTRGRRSVRSREPRWQRGWRQRHEPQGEGPREAGSDRRANCRCRSTLRTFV
jgi:hypothetical protein